MAKKYKKFVIFILTHGKPDNVVTYDVLKTMGCTYPIKFIIDNEDTSQKQYINNFGKENVIVFNKQKYIDKTDTMGDFGVRSAIVYARNFCFDYAKKIGADYFLQLDDDYTTFMYCINNHLKFPTHRFMIKSFDNVITSFITYLKNTAFSSIAFSQGGDWFGGATQFGKDPKRKAMNSFFCKTESPINFKGVFNEDVTAYVNTQSKGTLFLTVPHIQLNQQSTQSGKGDEAMSESYDKWGTYVKSFCTLMVSPSCVSIVTMGRTDRRLHHLINWKKAVPKIIRQIHKK